MYHKSPVFDPPSGSDVADAFTKQGFVIISWRNPREMKLKSELYIRDVYESPHCEGFGMLNYGGRSVEVKFCFKAAGKESHIILM